MSALMGRQTDERYGGEEDGQWHPAHEMCHFVKDNESVDDPDLVGKTPKPPEDRSAHDPNLWRNLMSYDNDRREDQPLTVRQGFWLNDGRQRLELK